MRSFDKWIAEVNEKRSERLADEIMYMDEDQVNAEYQKEKGALSKRLRLWAEHGLWPTTEEEVERRYLEMNCSQPLSEK